jgi:hypothetical protein
MTGRFFVATHPRNRHLALGHRLESVADAPSLDAIDRSQLAHPFDPRIGLITEEGKPILA